MTDDIVTRLRKMGVYGKNDPPLPIASEAADEIERLRKLVTTWIICAEMLVESNEGEAYEKAMDFYRDCQRIANETCQ
jgi:hypothetical protein